MTKHDPQEWTQPGSLSTSKNGNVSVASQPGASAQIPFMSHWNVSRPHVSLRDIIKEEQALQENMQKVPHHSKGGCIVVCSFWFHLYPSAGLSFRADRVVSTSTVGMELHH